MILIKPEAVSGHTGVFATVVSLHHVHLQSAVVVVDVRLFVQGAGATVLKPETQRHQLEPFEEIPINVLPLPRARFAHQVIFGMGEPKKAQSIRAR